MQIAVVILAIVYLCVRAYALEKASKARVRVSKGLPTREECEEAIKVFNNTRIRKDK